VRTEERLVRQLWQSMQSRDWKAVRDLLHPDLDVRWPHTRERFVGPDEYVAVNERYPGHWSIAVDRVVFDGTTAVSAVTVSEGSVDVFAASFFSFRDGLIHTIVEYWADSAQPPAWRRDAGLGTTY